MHKDLMNQFVRIEQGPTQNLRSFYTEIWTCVPWFVGLSLPRQIVNFVNRAKRLCTPKKLDEETSSASLRIARGSRDGS